MSPRRWAWPGVLCHPAAATSTTRSVLFLISSLPCCLHIEYVNAQMAEDERQRMVERESQGTLYTAPQGPMQVAYHAVPPSTQGIQPAQPAQTPAQIVLVD